MTFNGFRDWLSLASISFCLVVVPGVAFAMPEIDKPAPSFSVQDTTGKVVGLDSFKGKTVVLEWTNKGCPYVHKHYATGNMQKLQKDARDSDVVWLTVISSAPGLQGHMTADAADAYVAKMKASPAAVLLDEEGKMGRAYDARTTPQMYIIDGEGVLRYMGAIDDKPTANIGDVKNAKNFVTAALASLAAGKDVAIKSTRAYGCSVKYKY